MAALGSTLLIAADGLQVLGDTILFCRRMWVLDQRCNLARASVGYSLASVTHDPLERSRTFGTPTSKVICVTRPASMGSRINLSSF